MSRHTVDLSDPRIATARERDYHLYIETYCRASGCPTREVLVRVKDHDRELVPWLARRPLTCPVCGGPLVVHWVRTAGEYHEVRER